MNNCGLTYVSVFVPFKFQSMSFLRLQKTATPRSVLNTMDVNQGRDRGQAPPPRTLLKGGGAQYQVVAIPPCPWHVFDHLYHEALVLHCVRPNPVSHHVH